MGPRQQLLDKRWYQVFSSVCRGHGTIPTCKWTRIVQHRITHDVSLKVHFLPILLTRPRSVLRRHRAIPALLAAIRSATFLSTFISSYFLSVCLTRTLVLAKLFPWIPHDVWDGPYGCVLMGSLTCGWSVLIENARRRGEMALYVLPKALRASLPKWITTSSHIGARMAERLVLRSCLLLRS